MTALICSIVGLALTFLALVYKISAFATEQRVFVSHMKKQLLELKEELKSNKKTIARLPMIEYRLATVEKHLDISVPEMPQDTCDS